MHFQLLRNDETFGPYTRGDLQRYVTSGNVLLTDLVKSDLMPNWVTVEELLASGTGSGEMPPVRPEPPLAYAAARSPQYVVPPAVPYPDPPNLPWGLALLLGLVTGGLFFVVWDLVIAAWLRRVQPNSRALAFYAAATVLILPSLWIVGTHLVFGVRPMYRPNPLGNGVGLVCWILRLVARFSFRSSLEEHYNLPEPIGVRLGAVMTFFFGGLYFTYHLNRINRIKEGMRLHGATR